uniref:Gag-Pol polyprotein n=1 Tax=Tanacetum cinerariifolium TaxID=118510 RepID=A0A6L2JRM9_TANCI|nr:hypothetical protein [Tanacetum cinerariifolium]
MAVGSRNCPPMLAPGRYAQWQSRFLRYINTRTNGDSLRKCILEGPYQLTTSTIPAVPTTDVSPVVSKRTTVEILLNMTAHEMWIAIERLQQESMESYYSRFYKMMNEMIRNNLTVATMQVNVQFLQQLQPEWSRFVTIFKQQHDLDNVSYHKLFDVLKQYQKEVNEICVERIAKNANLLTLVATAQYPDPYYQAQKSHKSYVTPSKQSSSTISNASTKYKGKEIAKPITPPSESASKEDSDPEQAQKDKNMQKNLALIAKYFKKIYKPTYNNLRTSLNFRNKNVDTSSRYKNDNQTVQFGNQRTMTIGARETIDSQVKDHSYHKEKMLLCKQAEKGVPLQAEQVDWLADMDEEIDEQELEAHYGFLAMIQETDQNAKDVCAALSNLIANSTLDIEENKKILNQLKKANASLTQELKECKSNLEESNTTRDSFLIALQCKQTEFEKYMTFRVCLVK